MLCEELDEAALHELREAVAATMRESEAQDAPDPEGARELGECCLYLLEQYENLAPNKRRLVVGAVRYFAVADDPLDDATFASGLHDDKRIMNHVLEHLGVHDRYFDVR